METKKVSAWKEDNWWEPCIMKVTPYSLLPDTICGDCAESVDNFYSFIKNCLQNIIILEAQYDIQESCLKSKQKRDKSCLVDFSHKQTSKGNQTDDYLDVLIGRHVDLDEFRQSFPHTINYLNNPISTVTQNEIRLVDYDVDSESSLDECFDGKGEIILCDKLQSFTKICKLVDSYTSRRVFPSKTDYFDDTQKNLITEISQRKNLKRKNEFIETYKPKIYKLDSGNRRKSKIPKKLDTPNICEENFNYEHRENFLKQDAIKKELINGDPENLQNTNEKLLSSLPQSCLLCDTHFSGPSALASHVFEFHGIDMSEVVSSGSGESFPEKSKKKLPNLVKISDLKKTESIDNNQSSEPQQDSKFSKLSCPNCSGVFTSKQDLMMHLRLKHAQIAGFVCGICLYQCSSYLNLKNHLQNCSNPQATPTKYICQICQYGDDNFKWLENHVLVHDFLIETCKKQMRMFDPEDYIDINEACANTPYKGLNCVDCGLDEFYSFKEFSAHRRNEHSNFHCDLCNKFYGRNSHLWKHVNRLHKGHPSITCQLCYKTSASKYHLSQHFNKIHLAKGGKKSSATEKETLPSKFSFDFLSSKQNFIKEEFEYPSEQDDNSNLNFDQEDDNGIKEEYDEDSNNKNETPSAPKEIDSSHDMYTNIITNYTPPLNDGDFKCPKCSKGFHKKMLLKKHKKNCRPRMQKDLLTRCKSCARIFKDRQSLAKHLVNYHSEYTCEICTEKVQSKCEIVSHIRFRHPGCPLFCRICTNVLRSKSDLQEHMRNHFDSHICQFCGDPLPSKIKLKMHILSLHRKILSLSCGICLKLFENQHILRDHVKLIHKNQLTPLTSCPVCGKNYGSKWKTYDHINKSHGRIFRACKTCLEIFDNDAQLQAHCDVTAHGGGGQVGNSNTTALRNSIMAHIKSAINEVVEQNDENNDDSDSDDEGESDGDYKKQEFEEPKFYLSQNAKISLLEKRLLGKTLTDDEISIKPKLAAVSSNKKTKIPINETKSKTANKKEEESDPTNPQTNSSKRTVYVNSNDPSYCEICYKTWPAKKHLWQHYIRCHKRVAATVCGICLKTNDNYNTLQHHLRDNHPKLLHGQGFGSNFICRICGRYHNASSKLRLHMVIHENFDWKLLDGDKSDKDMISKSTTNGFKFTKGSEREEYDENINYESLIEQVECSSQSESDNDQAVQLKQDDYSSSEEQEEASEDSVISSNSIQGEINKKMPISTQQESSQRQDCSSSSEDSSTSYSEGSKSDSSDDCSRASQSLSSQSKFNPRSNSNTADDSVSSGNIFRRKPGELDSAIKSISYECMEPVDLNVVDDYCDLQNNCLNENEIESAVGSIL